MQRSLQLTPIKINTASQMVSNKSCEKQSWVHLFKQIDWHHRQSLQQGRQLIKLSVLWNIDTSSYLPCAYTAYTFPTKNKRRIRRNNVMLIPLSDVFLDIRNKLLRRSPNKWGQRKIQNKGHRARKRTNGKQTTTTRLKYYAHSGVSPVPRLSHYRN